MLIKTEKKGGIIVYTVDKNISDEKMNRLKNTYVTRMQIDFIIDHDADVYTKTGRLLLRFRKNKLLKDEIQTFYDNVIKFALNKTNNRGSTTGSEYKNVRKNPKIMTNIIGYFDKFSPKQKFLLKQQGKTILDVRETRFVMDWPEKFKLLIPLIKSIDKMYKQYIPENYVKQKKKADQTYFKIADTAFTTITTNVNFQTTIHTDKGDDEDGFGNLVVIEKGKYTGGEICFPQYGIGVDIRNNDVLFMNVHEWHGNLPIKLIDKDAKRLSVVCYLRKNIWEKTKNKTKKFMIEHNKTIKNLRK